MYDAAFNNIENILRTEDGISTELEYVEQTSWLLFLKYLSDLETERKTRAELDGVTYEPIIASGYAWGEWAYPMSAGDLNDDKALTGDDLIAFVDQELFPYLGRLSRSAKNRNSIQYKVGEVFGEIQSKFRNGYTLRDVIEQVQKLSFNTQSSRHELSHLYETRIKNMGNAGKNAGEYYTPRPLIRAMIKLIDPKVGETIYDGAVGSAGFLCEALDYMRSDNLSATEFETLQTKTFHGQEKKGLAYIIGLINMILHGIEAPNIVLSNSLNQNVMDIQDAERHDIILANPPFGGSERQQVQQNFPIKSSETAYLFLQHFMRKLKAGGRAAVVIKNTFLSNNDNASISLRRELLKTCDLHRILDCPQGTFQGAGVKTIVLFFTKGKETKSTWYYQLDPGRSLGKTNPLNDNDLSEFLELAVLSAESEKSWNVSTSEVDLETWDLTVNNPNKVEEVDNRTPAEIIAEIEELDAQAAQALNAIKELL